MQIRTLLPTNSRSISLRVILVGSLIGLAAMVTTGQIGRGVPWHQAALLGLLAVVALQVLIGYASFAVKWALRDWPASVHGGWRRALRVATHETAWMARLYLVDQPLLPAVFQWSAQSSGVPILLVHGFWCNGAVWRALQRDWPEPGRALVAVSLEPSYRSFTRQLDALGAAVQAVQRASGQSQVLLIGHSMGGLLARAYADRQPQQIRGVVCVAAPHRGTWFGELIYGREYGPPSPRARWLQAYNLDTAERCRVPSVCLWTADDNIVIPAGNSRMADGDNRSVPDCGHLAAICDRQAVALIAAAVLELERDRDATSASGPAMSALQATGVDDHKESV
jgi:pimeloyl-ACP methyl ester carboxylesterase